ncbi:MAG: hypothetical protein ACREPL_06625, partial [Rhodanobacteraceae bacterium]
MNIRSGLVRIATYCLLAASVGLPPATLASVQGTSTVLAGKARFEFLTPSLVRMEYSPTGNFVDVPTAVVEKRDWPHVDLSKKL